MASAETTTQRRAGGYRIAVLAGVAAVVLGLDVLTKILAVARLDPGRSPRLLGGLIYLSITRNSGAAFGFATGATVVFALISVAVAVVIVRAARRLRSTLWAIALGLLLGGAVGNLADRIFRAPAVLRGGVVDFISVFGPDGEHFPIFNLADSAITCAVVLLCVAMFCGIGIDGRVSGR